MSSAISVKLLSASANPNTQAKNCETACSITAHTGYQEGVKVLHDAGAV